MGCKHAQHEEGGGKSHGMMATTQHEAEGSRSRPHTTRRREGAATWQEGGGGDATPAYSTNDGVTVTRRRGRQLHSTSEGGDRATPHTCPPPPAHRRTPAVAVCCGQSRCRSQRGTASRRRRRCTPAPSGPAAAHDTPRSPSRAAHSCQYTANAVASDNPDANTGGRRHSTCIITERRT
jgi:hypothetical protein